MKRTLLGIIATSLAATIWFGAAKLLITPVAAQEPTALIFSVSFTGNPTEHDTAAAQLLIDAENLRLASLDPPGTPLPDSTPAEIKASALSILSATIQRAWDSYAKQAGNAAADESELLKLFRNASDSTRVAVEALLTP